MDEHDNNTSDDISRIRSFDPAADVEAPNALRERVAAITSDGNTEVDTDEADGAHPAPVPLRRKRPWIAPVAAAAALIVAIGGGYVVGSMAQPVGTPEAGVADASLVPVGIGTAENPAPPVSLGGDASGVVAASAMSADAGMGPESAQSLVTADMQSTAGSVDQWHYSNKRRFSVPSFEAGPDSATVYALDGRAQFSADDATRIANALGIEGEAFQDPQYAYGWQVGTEAAPSQSFASLWLNPNGGGDVWFNSDLIDPWSTCYNDIEPQYDLNTGNEETYRAFDAEVRQCIDDTPMPSEQQAREALSLFLSATGVDEASTEVTVDVNEENRIINATAARVVDGNVTVVTSSVTVSHVGVLSGWGPTATIESLGDYAIVTPDEAAARLNDPVYAPQWASTQAQEVDYEYEQPTEPPALPEAGTPVPWGITDFEIESARLGLALMTGTKDERFLAPAYEFTDTDGNVWSVIALAESELNTLGGGSGYGGGGWWGPLY